MFCLINKLLRDEYILQQLIFVQNNKDFIYCNSIYFDNIISHIRNIGQPFDANNQFMTINPKARMDGVIFVKESE